MPTVYVEIDGKPQPITECEWIQTAPCGCVCAWLSPGGDVTFGRPNPPLLTEEQLAAEYEIPKWQQEQERAQGFKYELIDRTAAFASAKANKPCPHIPKWGVTPRAEADGHEWAFKSGSRTFHLVPSDAVRHFGESFEDRVNKPRNVGSLCGATAYAWDDTKFKERPDCKRCAKIAREQVKP